MTIELTCEASSSRLIFCKRQVHAGFDADYKSTAPAMKEALGYVLSKFPTSPLWITGHSLGGALAMLAALDLHSNHSIATAGVYTFGQPRLGNQALALHFKVRALACLRVAGAFYSKARSRHTSTLKQRYWMHAYDKQEVLTKDSTPYYRVAHAQDPVVHIPPVLLGFWHAPFEVFYNKASFSLYFVLWCGLFMSVLVERCPRPELMSDPHITGRNGLQDMRRHGRGRDMQQPVPVSVRHQRSLNVFGGTYVNKDLKETEEKATIQCYLSTCLPFALSLLRGRPKKESEHKEEDPKTL